MLCKQQQIIKPMKIESTVKHHEHTPEVVWVETTIVLKTGVKLVITGEQEKLEVDNGIESMDVTFNESFD